MDNNTAAHAADEAKAQVRERLVVAYAADRRKKGGLIPETVGLLAESYASDMMQIATAANLALVPAEELAALRALAALIVRQGVPMDTPDYARQPTTMERLEWLLNDRRKQRSLALTQQGEMRTLRAALTACQEALEGAITNLEASGDYQYDDEMWAASDKCMAARDQAKAALEGRPRQTKQEVSNG